MSPVYRLGDSFVTFDGTRAPFRFAEFWDLMDTIRQHGYMRAAMSVIGRSAIGAGWAILKNPDYAGIVEDAQRQRLHNFYTNPYHTWSNVKDFQSMAYKLMLGVMYLRYFGQAAYYIVRDAQGNPIGLDFLHGLVVPNVDSSGSFKSPAFIQYPSRNQAVSVSFEKPTELVYLVYPEWEGSPMGGSDIEALSTYTLPLDIYLQLSAREYMKNRDRPEVVYQLPPDISEDGFNKFVTWMEQSYAGAGNMGKSPVAVQGEFDIKELRPLPKDLPYQQSREDTREEELAVAGVNGAKLGISSQMASANLREMRREFHETSLIPLCLFVETGFYEQIHVREFKAPGWSFKFNSPDFLTAVERATVHMRYYSLGVLTPNEIRTEIGKLPRQDPGGDVYAAAPVKNEPGSPPEGRPVEPDAPSQVGEPTNDNQDPVRGDQHDDNTRESMVAELALWRKFAVRRFKKGRTIREFETTYIPGDLREVIQPFISQAKTIGELNSLFDEVTTLL
jgi:phage portal protein BeeE